MTPGAVASRSSAIPLSLLFAALVVYASLYPFDGWRWPAGSAWAFLDAPLPRYWTKFDVMANLVGYMPLGFLVALGLLRSGWGRWAWVLALLLPALLSLLLETLQNLLPMRVPSNLDLGLNIAGGGLGVCIAWLLERLGVMRQWTHFRRHWFAPHAHGSLVLLALWPFALLYPVSVPFGLGQVWVQLEQVLSGLLADTPFLVWLPMQAEAAVPLSPLAQALCVALGLLAPLMLGYADVPVPGRRVVLMIALLVSALGAAGLSAAMTYGPDHAWAWVDMPALLGMGGAAVVALVTVSLPSRVCHVGLLLALAVSLSLLNRAPVSAYFDQSLDVWEQGRFIRFHGLSQWLGWLWPFAALVYAVRAVTRLPLGRQVDH
ncbi:VanZ family protein [Hydrogenophaga pseudoflava]|uniref:VanZ family protein n=1 Tax=Hydrogenophaga pseudoflava TaxID=47421 RepID=UPI0027E47C93|nr:VanZ family protein [Hydrogenophaga pseudoflava]MDQ7745913.1 VanZ family protein [Hydrogenophaga pseudoflava]